MSGYWFKDRDGWWYAIILRAWTTPMVLRGCRYATEAEAQACVETVLRPPQCLWA
jgi:hypothetical protein